MKKISIGMLAALGLCAGVSAAEQTEYADMSDPMAVFNMAGIGTTNKGLNLKLVQLYDTGSATKIGANVLEVKGFAGELMGWDNNDVRNDSIDSIRFRNFTVNTETGLGMQFDSSWHFGNSTGSLSYSLMQALPQMGRFNFYPLAGAGMVTADSEMPVYVPELGDNVMVPAGFTMPGAFAQVGVYSKFTVSDRIWLNYNPMYVRGISGQLNGESLLSHEFAVSYQLNQRQNIRLFANWSENVKFQHGDFRIEFNQQF